MGRCTSLLSPFTIHHSRPTKQSYNAPMRRRWKALVAVGAVALLAVWIVNARSSDQLPFDKVVWDRGPVVSHTENTERKRMLGAILKMLPVGSSSQDVLKVLGKPDYLPPREDWASLAIPALPHHKDVNELWGYCLADVQTSRFLIPIFELVYLFFGLDDEEKVVFAQVQYME